MSKNRPQPEGFIMTARLCWPLITASRSRWASCSTPTDDEEDQLDEAYGLTAHSRLACQCVPSGTENLVVQIPAWNRNLAREPH